MNKRLAIAAILVVLTGACGQLATPREPQGSSHVQRQTPSAPTPLEPPVLTEWRNFVQFGCVMYRATDVGCVAQDDDLGPEFARTVVKLDPNLPPLPYRPKDGDALLLAPGTPVYTVKGWRPEFLLAARLSADLILFQADNPKGSTGRDVLDFTTNVHSIGINTPRDQPKYEMALASISDPRQVTQLIELIMDAPVGRDEYEHSGARYSIVFSLADGSTITCTYWVESRKLCRAIEAPAELRAAVKRAVPKVTPTRAPTITAYKDVALPMPRYGKVRNGKTQLPPAWLIIDDQAIPATYGSYTVSFDIGGGFTESEHGDAAPPDMNPDLATAALPAGGQAIIVLGAEAVSEFHARVAEWPLAPNANDPSSSGLEAERQPDTGVTVYRLQTLNASRDQVLLVSIAFKSHDAWGDANYLWRLSPAPP